MAPIVTTAPRQDGSLAGNDDEHLNVLLTGFSQFGKFNPNPSWLAVQPLHDTVIDLITGQDPDSAERQRLLLNSSNGTRKTKIRIQCVQVPVAYRPVLDVIPRLHGNATAPSPDAEPWLDPKGDQDGSQGDGRSFPKGYSKLKVPKGGWDFILHVGTGMNGSVAVETLAHKERYITILKDAQDQDPPIITTAGEAVQTEAVKEHEASQAAADKNDTGERKVPFFDAAKKDGAPNRGFGVGYEHGQLEEQTLIDVPALVAHLTQEGKPHGPVIQNKDPGRYVCDFIFYASLAEARRKKTGQQKHGFQGEQVPQETSTDKETPVLFIHCPDVGLPQSSEQMGGLLKDVVAWVCRNHT